MAVKNEGEKMNENVNEILQTLKTDACFEIEPFKNDIDFENSSRFTKLKLSSEQKIHFSALAQGVLPAVATGVMANSYIVRFPEGLPHTLTSLKQGGVGSMIKGDNGQIVGHASFYSLQTQAVIMGAFTAMSVVSGQYFLAQINKEMQMINMKLDDILKFLYGDKKAELIAEMSFVRYAYENYNSIMLHEPQRIATLTSLQQSRKIAMKDMEFYIYDLEYNISKKIDSFEKLKSRTRKCFQIKDCLKLSQQLFVMSSIMEVFFAQNQDKEYLSAIEKDIVTYIDKCDKRILTCFAALKGNIKYLKVWPLEKQKKYGIEKQINTLVDSLNNGEESDMRESVRLALYAHSKITEYYVDKNGSVYIAA